MSDLVQNKAPAKRQLPQPAPLWTWARAAALAVLIAMAIGAQSAIGDPQMPEEVDREFYEAQFQQLDTDLARLEGEAKKPVSIVFMGTSRMKNVAFDPASVGGAAQKAGLEYPIASTFLAVNWGGFQRFAPAIPMIEARRPDALVVMADLLREDFSNRAKVRIGYRHLSSSIWNEPFSIFDSSEFERLACSNFREGLEDRNKRHSRWITSGTDLPGPKFAQATLERLAAKGIQIYVVEVPVTIELARMKGPPDTSGGFLEKAAEGAIPNIVYLPMTEQPPREIFCDWSHISPDKAEWWNLRFFNEISGDLASLQR